MLRKGKLYDRHGGIVNAVNVGVNRIGDHVYISFGESGGIEMSAGEWERLVNRMSRPRTMIGYGLAPTIRRIQEAG
jgi:hypothetical protein